MQEIVFISWVIYVQNMVENMRDRKHSCVRFHSKGLLTAVAMTTSPYLFGYWANMEKLDFGWRQTLLLYTYALLGILLLDTTTYKL